MGGEILTRTLLTHGHQLEQEVLIRPRVCLTLSAAQVARVMVGPKPLTPLGCVFPFSYFSVYLYANPLLSGLFLQIRFYHKMKNKGRRYWLNGKCRI